MKLEGFWDIIYIPVGWLIKLCYTIVPNYLFALLIFAVLTKILLLPFGYKQHKNSLKQASFRPKEMAIAKKYQNRNDRTSQQRKQEEIQRLYQAENFNQFAGCLPLLIQLPLIFCIYGVVTSPLRYICGFSSEVVTKIMEISGATRQIDALNLMRENFSAYTGIEGFPTNINVADLPTFTVLGVDLAATPRLGIDLLLLIPVFSFITTFFTSKITKKFTYQPPQVEMQNASGNENMSLKVMEFVMPAMTTYIAFTVPAVIGIYWIYQNLLGILQQYAFFKLKPFPTFTEEEYKEAERLIAGKQKKQKYREKKNLDPDRPRVRSLHHIDDDEYNAHVVENSDEKRSDEKLGSDGMLTPFPMKDYSDKKKK